MRGARGTDLVELAAHQPSWSSPWSASALWDINWEPADGVAVLRSGEVWERKFLQC